MAVSLTRTWDITIHQLDWLKSILSAVQIFLLSRLHFAAKKSILTNSAKMFSN